MKKILLFGATGMAGHIVYYYFKEKGQYDIVNVVFRHKLNEESIVVDVTNKEAVSALIFEQKPDVIINCIGVLIKGSKSHPDNAIYVNAYFPHLLKRLADEIDAKLVHISTDCVFTGNKGAYTESDFKDADDIYGRSKALGEIDNNKDLTIRTSIIGPELKTDGEGLFHWFMNQNGNVNGFTNAIWGGVTTIELAKAINVAIKQDITGLVHLSNGIPINKYEILLLFKKIFRKDSIIVIPFKGVSCNKSIAKSNLFLYEVPSYEIMLIEMFDWMNSHPTIYREKYL
ncbi:SDR family oxidoreductase [Lutibacter sp.]|uniref:dTDP-4-dehydrorhamnose reductase family protein n=1 Tax=Lutibacter sp. TaxID=1925666 RepID=UPI0025BE4A02|nr:SDR family oxidoreductase [Lutibacter sp.]MCF6182101.1 SDR family oxidoreductase [Lutibacter sp.]